MFEDDSYKVYKFIIIELVLSAMRLVTIPQCPPFFIRYLMKKIYNFSQQNSAMSSNTMWYYIKWGFRCFLC